MLNIYVLQVQHYTFIHIGNLKMTTIVANTFEIIGLDGIANWFKNLNAELQRRRNIKHTIKQLSELSNRELNDIGISRGDIWHIAHQSYPKALRGEAVETNRNLRGWV